MLGVHWLRHAQAAYPRSRSQNGVATSFPCQTQGQVATSFQGRDLLDDQARSRRQPHVTTSLPPSQTNQVATSKMGSRLQYLTGQVATLIPCRDLLETNLCRDIDFMSRLHFFPQWGFQITTPKPKSRPPTLPPMSRHKNDVTTWGQEK